MSTTSSVKPALGAIESGCARAAVIGAGSMGAGIAAQFANAGIPVDLLDIPSDIPDRNARAKSGIAAQIKARGFMGPAPVALVRPGNTEDDFDRLAEADWIIEAVIENLDIKRALFARIETVRKPGAVVSSNTSTIPRAELVAGRSEAFASHFLISHFFNPPRYMELLENVGVAGEADEFARRVARDVLGKTVVDCRDTPGFIANRIGCTWLAVAICEAIRLGLTIEEADAIQTAFGAPRTGAFGLADLVGIDMIPSIWGSLMNALPRGDTINRFDLPAQKCVSDLIGRGHNGRKSGQGFYGKSADGKRQALDLVTGQYRPARKVTLSDLPGGGDLAALLADDTGLGAYTRTLLQELLTYSAAHAPSIAQDVENVDVAMELGYAWKKGPLKLLSELEPLTAQIGEFDLPAAPAPAVVTEHSGDRLHRAKSGGSPIVTNEAASLWDIGDGVACLELHTRMNAINSGVLELIETTTDRCGGDVRSLLIANHHPRAFSAGADLSFLAALLEARDWDTLDQFVRRGQAAYRGLRAVSVPVVAAPAGLTLGGGCELMLHCDTVVAYAETQVGLPESTLGVLPAWGGTLRVLTHLLSRRDSASGPVASAADALTTLLSPRPAGSAREASAAGLLPADADIVMHRSTLIDRAAERAAALCEGYTPPAPEVYRCGGPSAAQGLLVPADAGRLAGRMSDADFVVASQIASVLTGGSKGDPSREIAEAEFYDMEREAFLHLAQQQATLPRIRHMLETGRPLKN